MPQQLPKERPILFSGPMVRAIIEGRKTQTRRVVKPQPIRDAFQGEDGATVLWDRWPARLVYTGDRSARTERLPCPYGVPGDRLWVRETCDYFAGDEKEPATMRRIQYRADDEDAAPACFGRWCPSILTPRWTSRIDLEIVSVRVERLQEIQEADAIAEGMTIKVRENGALAVFRDGWDTINGKRAPWASNPWVWVIQFRRLIP